MTTPQHRARPFPTPALALRCVGLLGADGAAAKKAHAPRPASAPTTAQILAPSAATVPDALPPDRRVFRCGSRYSSSPCEPAQDVADARTEAQRRQSDDITARQQRLAAWYEAARHEREKAPSAAASGRPASAPAVCTSTIMMSCVPKKPRARIVSGPGGAKAAAGGKSKS